MSAADKEFEEKMAYWHEKSKEFPFPAECTLKQPKPHEVSDAEFGPFVCVPLKLLGCSFWGFQTEAARDKFARHFPVHRYDVRGQ